MKRTGRYNRLYNTTKAREWRHKATSILVEALGGKCQICGYDRCNRALDFHHVDKGSKLDTIGQLMTKRTWKLIVEEVKKCVLLCSNCHREVHDGIATSPPLRDYEIPNHLYRNGDIDFAGRKNRKCPVSAEELVRLREVMSLRTLSVRLDANERVIMRWCTEAGCKQVSTSKRYVISDPSYIL